jgi:hypothetical protein
MAWNEDQCNLAAHLMGIGSDLRASYPTLTPSASPADQVELMCEQADAVDILMSDALEPLDAKEQELTRLGYCLRPSKEFLRLQRYETRLRKVYNEAMQSFRQSRAEQVVASEPITCLPTEPEPTRLVSSLIQTLATEPEPEPIADSDSPFEGQPIMAMLAALVESIGQGSESEPESESEPPTSTPSAPPVSLTSALPKPPAAPLNRKARRARDKAARKLKAMAR